VLQRGSLNQVFLALSASRAMLRSELTLVRAQPATEFCGRDFGISLTSATPRGS
jgi:hypothetical protein